MDMKDQLTVSNIVTAAALQYTFSLEADCIKYDDIEAPPQLETAFLFFDHNAYTRRFYDDPMLFSIETLLPRTSGGTERMSE